MKSFFVSVWRFFSFFLLLSGLIAVALLFVFALWDKNSIPYKDNVSYTLIFSFIFMLIGSTGIEKTFKIINNMIKAKKGT